MLLTACSELFQQILFKMLMKLSLSYFTTQRLAIQLLLNKVHCLRINRYTNNDI